MSLCLVLVCKNESRVIARALRSVKPFITSYVIGDSGSTDDTMDIIRRELSGIPGELIQVPWEGFGPTKTNVLEKARGKAGHILLLDADQEIKRVGTLPIVPDDGRADQYLVRYEGPLGFRMPQIINGFRHWRFVGVAHEYLEATDGPATRVNLDSIVVVNHTDGATPRKEKFERDVVLLTQGLIDEPANSRYKFYLANSFRDLGRNYEARATYQERVVIGGWAEEVFCALYEDAKLSEAVADPWGVTMDLYIKAHQYRPCRLEPLFRIARHYRKEQLYAAGLLFARTFLGGCYPNDILFVERSVYLWEAPMELAICAYYCGEIDLAKMVYAEILRNSETPLQYREQCEKNLAFCPR